MQVIKPWDIVRTPKGAIAIVTETNGDSSAIAYFSQQTETFEKVAWWHEGELQILGSAIETLVNACADTSGRNYKQGTRLIQSVSKE